MQTYTRFCCFHYRLYTYLYQTFDLGGSKEPHIRWGSRLLDERGNFRGLSHPLKSIGVSAAALNTEKISITATVGLQQPVAMLLTSWFHITLSAVKNSPSTMRHFVKILLRLVF